jgi:tRNA-2-methylthio-N6-dimethylallyladenosine synthase
MNEYDSEIIADILTGDGYSLTDDVLRADVVLLNTCSVREHAEEKVWSELGRLSKIKKNKPLTIGVCGCMAQKEGARIIHRFPSVNLVCGTHSLIRIGELLSEAKTGKRIVDVREDEKLPFSNLSARKNRGVSASLAVMRGCSRFCSYCVVPYLRGKEESRELEEITDEVVSLTEQGFKEFLLLGQDITLYRWRDIDLAGLLEKVNNINGVERIRFVTSHPSGITPRLLGAVSDLPKVCEHLHIPLQSGSNRILKAMNRGYTRDFYLNLASRAREVISGLSITTDLIVGFPGESEEDFEETLDVVREVEFDRAFMYKYSIRSGTKAAEIKNEVPENIKKDRLKKLQEVQDEISLKRNESFLGRRVEVLAEEVNKKNPFKLLGRTRTNKVVAFKGEEGIIGKLVNLTITEVSQWTLKGKIN